MRVYMKMSTYFESHAMFYINGNKIIILILCISGDMMNTQNSITYSGRTVEDSGLIVQNN